MDDRDYARRHRDLVIIPPIEHYTDNQTSDTTILIKIVSLDDLSQRPGFKLCMPKLPDCIPEHLPGQ
jgi:hypothetical protein